MTPLRPSETMRLPLRETRLPGDWRGEDLAKDPDAYTVLLHDEERRALHALTTSIERGGVGESIASDAVGFGGQSGSGIRGGRIAGISGVAPAGHGCGVDAV